jgi:HK97 family phage prohead protease
MIITRSGAVAFDTEVQDLAIARSMSAPSALRAAEDDTVAADTLGRLIVNFTKFGTWYEVNSWWEGRFLERTVKGALRKTIKERGPKGSGMIRCLFDHGFDFHVGDKILTVPDVLGEGDEFATLEGDLLDTSYNRDLKPGLERGGYGSSFMFRVVKDSWDREPKASDHNPEALPERSVTEIALYEAGPVTWPANEAATAELNSARSDTDRMYEALQRRDPSGVAQLRQRIMNLRTTAGLPADPFTGVPEAARDADEPAARHSDAAMRRLIASRLYREAVIGQGGAK